MFCKKILGMSQSTKKAREPLTVNLKGVPGAEGRESTSPEAQFGRAEPVFRASSYPDGGQLEGTVVVMGDMFFVGDEVNLFVRMTDHETDAQPQPGIERHMLPVQIGEPQIG